MESKRLTALVKQAQSGDSAAMEQLLTYAHTSVSYQCRKFMKTPEDAEDMTQEVLLAIYQKLDTLTDPTAFLGWAKRIAATRCMNALSRTYVELQFAEDEDGNSFADTLEELDQQKIPDAAIDNAETARMVTELIDALPEAQRICTYLYYYDELSVKEIAALTASSENTVKSRLNYARKAIKEGVLDHEKKGIKLYGLSPLPFLLYFIGLAAKTEASGTAAAACVSGVMAANAAAAATAATATTATTATAATATTATTATAVSGKVAGGVAGFLSKKLIAGVLAGVVTLGGGAVATVQVVNNRAETVPAFICHHEWEAADCTTAKTCGKCDSVEGEALGHTWTDADCEHPQTCQICGATEGEALGHAWTEATCETAQICQTCAAVGTDALGHDMAEANYQQPAHCTREGCTYTEGEKKPVDYMGPYMEAEFGKEYDYVTTCFLNSNYKTVGKLTLSDYAVFESGEGFAAIEGYVYHTVTVNILYSDINAQKYAPSAAGWYSFLYNAAPWSASKDVEYLDEDGRGRSFSVSYYGKRYEDCHVYWSDWEFSEWDMSTRTCVATKTTTWRVPAGYDGIVMIYYDYACEPVDGQYSWEFMNPEALAFWFPENDLGGSATESPDKPTEETNDQTNGTTTDGDAPGISDQSTSDLAGHQHEYTTTEVAPSCAGKGYIKHTCSCGTSYTSDEKPALAHEFTTQTMNAIPAMQIKAYYLHTCKNCGYSYKEDIPETDSDDGEHKGQYYEDGSAKWIAWDCASQGHHWCYTTSTWNKYKSTTVREATCTQLKIEEYYCDVEGCGASEQREVANSYANHLRPRDTITGVLHQWRLRIYPGEDLYYMSEEDVQKAASYYVERYKNGENCWVMFIEESYVQEETNTYECQSCGQTLNNSSRYIWVGTSPYDGQFGTVKMDYYSKDNQPEF